MLNRLLRRLVAWLALFMVIGLIYFVTQPTPGVETVLVPPGQGGEMIAPAVKACKDSSHMNVDYTRDYGAQRIYVQLKKAGYLADCDTQFGKVTHLTVYKHSH